MSWERVRSSGQMKGSGAVVMDDGLLVSELDLDHPLEQEKEFLRCTRRRRHAQNATPFIS